ncbi:AAA family ATPase [Sphingosinicella sp. CPCC 101087]|uniref:AAA family ATPase n=1 Tax=Sphingosinicella sp. CPCC 101087 TaxID=2497754 RepID=UPI00101BAEFE|nr:AAA family ATPase [Sphingosinicella sp. CPCC 101087]
MLNSIRLRNFKSFDDVVVPMKPLTVILGPNGAGKSSMIQALALLRQSLGQHRAKQAVLNGSLVSLGTGHDVLRQGADEDVIELTLTGSEDRSGVFRMGYNPEADVLPLGTPFAILPELISDNFVYLAAERVGPRLVGPRSLQSAERREMGPRGEGALAVLERFRAEILPKNDPRRGGQGGSLEELFQMYLGQICPTARIELHPYGEVDSIGSSFVFTPPGGLPSLPVRPTNVGFGLSYALPIIVAALVAQPGGTLIVENPEAHLHTVSQRAMTELLYRTAAAGAQVIVETHSRETFHWLRNSSMSRSIDGSIVCINYFQAVYDESGRVSRCSTLNSSDDSLQDWPQSFFDEYGSPGDLIAPVVPVPL